MGALAQSEHVVSRGLLEARPNPARRSHDRRTRSGGHRRSDWNVLAEELVPFHPPTARRLVKVQSVDPSPRRVGRAGELLLAKPSAPPAPTLKALADKRRVAARPRGLRRLLPGAATLAVLASVWVGAGSLAGVHRPTPTVPASAVKVQGGYLYTARPGDTLWSIASGLEPGGDPRPLVDQLEQQLHGAQLVAGDELKLP